ncbi:hypothetical protein CK203_065180 [Vitis vinifera]|uniref:Ubiquitin-like protease family profile domain-containing protein n=1 Tax=Vitis vinifera TaxID=29760 RepID=A0A438G2C3_VITVI|nr:hypothetical protein CK203_065180 [Vitis vinifera]
MAPRRDKKQMDERKENRRLLHQKGVGEGYVQLVSYMGVLARTMVPVYHTDWRVVPMELKEKLWDCVKGAFLVDENSKNNVISSIGTSFRSFRHRLTKEYILPYKDKPEYLLQPPTEYNYIPIEDWRKLVANRLSKEFQVKSKKGKERREKYVYIHRVSRKGYAGLQEELMQKTGSRKPIDRWVLWKLARLKKDELTKAVEEGKITCVGQKDILTLALGTLEHPGREECQRMLMEKVKSLEEEIIALKAGKKEPLTPRSKVSSTNIRKQLLQHEEIGGKTHDSAHVENLSAQGTRKASPLTQVYKCKLALETEDNIVAYGTYLRDSQISIDGADILVVILYPLQPNALLPFPLSENIRTIREGVGYEVLWPIAFVINDDDEDVGKRKNKMKKIQASPKKIKYENPRDVQLFSKTFQQCWRGVSNFVSQKKKGSKKELKWMVVEGPKQLDGVMCGYFVMRYMRDIIANRSLLTSQFEGKKTYSRAELDEVRSEWVSFLSTLILDQVYCCNFEVTRSYVHRNVIQHKGKCHSSSPLKWCSPWKESSSHQLVFGLPMP